MGSTFPISAAADWMTLPTAGNLHVRQSGRLRRGTCDHLSVAARERSHRVSRESVRGFIEDNIRLKPNFSVYLGMRYYFQNYFHDDSNNVAPRFGFAYAPTKHSRTVIRGGAGIFYDRTGPTPIGDLFHFNGINLLRFIVNNPVIQNPGNPTPPLIDVPTSVVVLDPRARIPYSVQYSVGVERQVTAKSTFSATFVGSRGIDVFRSLDTNAPLPPITCSRPTQTWGRYAIFNRRATRRAPRWS